MHEGRRGAALVSAGAKSFAFLIALAGVGCGGTSGRPPATSEPLVIPPMGASSVTAAPPPPLAPAPTHPPTHEECIVILRRLIELPLDGVSIFADPKQREELILSLVQNAELSRNACGKLQVNDASMQCVASATVSDEVYKCLAGMTVESPAGEPAREPAP